MSPENAGSEPIDMTPAITDSPGMVEPEGQSVPVVSPECPVPNSSRTPQAVKTYPHCERCN